jgi:hypothetical protein
MRRQADERKADAQGIRDESQEQLRKADEMDPDVNTDDQRKGGRGSDRGAGDRDENRGPDQNRDDEGRHVARDADGDQRRP